MPEVHIVKVADLSLDLENPRFEPADNQKHALEMMLLDQGEKILRLAEDILTEGLDPSERLITAYGETVNDIVVLDGNTRITALKLLHSPEIADSIASISKSKLKKLVELFAKKSINEVECVVYNERIEAERWIKLKHTGENNGVGRQGWDSKQSGRFGAKAAGKAPSIDIQVLDYMKGSSLINNDIKSSLKNVPTTTLRRLLSEDVRSQIGLRLGKDGFIETQSNEEDLVKMLTRFVSDLLSDTKVGDVFDEKLRAIYLNKIRSEGIDIVKKPSDDKGWVSLTSGSAPNPISFPAASPVPVPKKKNKVKPLPLSTDRYTIIPKDFILKIDDPRVNKIYYELRHLEIDKNGKSIAMTYENSGAVILRVFVELSVKLYMDAKGISAGHANDPKLKLKVEAVANHMEVNNILSKHQLKRIRNSISNDHDLLSINTFNAYVHNDKFIPVAKELKLAWDGMQEFIKAIWENVN